MKKIIFASTLIFLAAGCSKTSTPVAINPTPTPTPVVTTTPESTATPEPTATIDEAHTVYIEWTFKTLPDGKYDEPFSEVGLKLSGAMKKTIDLGKFSSCSVSNEDFDPDKHNNQLTALYCWWAGAGDHLTVLWNDPEKLTIYREEMDENPEGKRYVPYLIKTIAIPRDYAVEVITGE